MTQKQMKCACVEGAMWDERGGKTQSFRSYIRYQIQLLFSHRQAEAKFFVHVSNDFARTLVHFRF